MKQILSNLINSFHEKTLPEVVRRAKEVAWLPQKANVIIGMRRTGKTWFCYQLMHELMAQGVAKEQLLYLNFEDERLLPFETEDFQHILDVYYRKYPEYRDRYCYIFLDEIQRIVGWESYIRRILDNEKVYVCVTGSSAKLLSTEIATALRGRSLTTEMYPYHFSEILAMNGIEKLIPTTIGADKRARIEQLFDKYYKVGGFPEIQTLDKELRYQILRNYIDVVMLRDVIERYGVKNTLALRRLIRHLLHNPATNFSVNKFYNSLRSQQIPCTKNDLYAFMDHLCDAFLVYSVPLHTRSEKARQVNPKKVYIIDHGLLHAMSLEITQDKGAMLENIVFMHLQRGHSHVEYYITQDGYEVDFIARDDEGNKTLLQVCWYLDDDKTFEREKRALIQAKKELKLDQAVIVTWDTERECEEGIKAIPIWKWLIMSEQLNC